MSDCPYLLLLLLLLLLLVLVLLLLLLLLLLIVLLNAGLIQSCAKFCLRPQADEGWHV